MEAEKAFITHIERHQALIYKVCHLYCDRAEDKQDLFQEIVFQLWKSYPTFRGEAKFTTWLYRIALNTALTAIKKNKRHDYVYSLPLEMPLIEENDKDRLETLNRAVAHLSDIEKSIVMLYLEERSYEEMEDILGINQNNLRVKMNRIKEKLKKLRSEEHTSELQSP